MAPPLFYTAGGITGVGYSVDCQVLHLFEGNGQRVHPEPSACLGTPVVLLEGWKPAPFV